MSERGVVVITGGASGIGLAAARELLEAGRRVLVADLAPANLERAREALAAHGEGAVRYEELDVTDEAGVARVLDGCEATFGPVRGLVNSAGTGRDVPFLDTPAALLRSILEVNLVGTFLVAREAAARMVAGGGGAIVNITSVSGLRGNLGRAAYGASKGGVVTLTKVMAVELAPHGVARQRDRPRPRRDAARARDAHPRLPRGVAPHRAPAPLRGAGRDRGRDRLPPRRRPRGVRPRARCSPWTAASPPGDSSGRGEGGVPRFPGGERGGAHVERRPGVFPHGSGTRSTSRRSSTNRPSRAAPARTCRARGPRRGALAHREGGDGDPCRGHPTARSRAASAAAPRRRA